MAQKSADPAISLAGSPALWLSIGMRAQLKSVIALLALGLPLALLSGCAGSGPTWVAQGPVTIVQIAAPTHINTPTHTRTTNYNSPATIDNSVHQNAAPAPAPRRDTGPMRVAPRASQDQPRHLSQNQNGSVLYAYADPYGPDYDRRDAELGVGSSSATDGWYAWPEPQHPTLDRSRSFNTGRSPERYVYPSRDGGRNYYRSGRARSYRGR